MLKVAFSLATILPTGFCQNAACADEVFIVKKDYGSLSLHNTLEDSLLK